MRKLLFVTITLLMGIVADAQEFSNVVSKYRQYEDAECVQLGSFLFSLARPFIISEIDPDDPEYGIITRIKPKGMSVMDLSDCSSSVKSNFKRDMDRLVKNSAYKVLMKVHDEDDDVAFYAKTKGNSVSEIILYVKGDDCAAIQFKVNANIKDIQKLLELSNDN